MSDERQRGNGRAPRIVAFGGGHGLYATLSAARRLSSDVTAVVTVADDGGSSGRLRSELGVIPPGDLRMALAALAAREPNVQVWTDTVQHRFGGTGALAGHSVGNLIIAGLSEVLGDTVAALDTVARLLQIEGRVLPMSPVALEIEADVVGLETDPRVSRCIRGQVAVATTPGKVRRVRLRPANPPACPEALDAVDVADLVVLGPGSWFSSVIPHVLVPELLDAVKQSPARKVLILNLAPEPGETAGFSAERHLHVLCQHAPDLRVDHVVVDSASVPAGRERDHLCRAAEQLGAEVVYADVAEDGSHKHHAGKLAAVLDRLSASVLVGVRPDMHDVNEQAAERTAGGRESATWR
ncbi:gluconeogenesis factor YvcK family protein [Prescottella agglutinans]|uniref:Putative gluconeogenesis factor n=1 Tax=Prescottella agglutinans TaxID=1644129 RepID=A0ABT6MAL9_9NOCA|nr:uridine diphosphate-N-acetylglucosamine-binding protein YvcK [Prescottella agglutinans]MDH6281341.1 putative cofD-like protein [Prescottella agglutinans]